MQDKLAIAIVVLLVLSLVIVAGMNFYDKKIQIDTASEYVLEDLVGKYPTADSVEIMDWKNLQNEKGEDYLRIRAAVTEGLYTPCPVRVHYFYHYPLQKFVADAPEYITTSACEVCEGEGCAIAFAEEAIIASHTNTGAESVHRYTKGYSDAIPTATLTETGWKVVWNSNSAKFGYVVDIAKNGEIEKVETTYH